MYAKSLGSLDVARSIVYKESLRRDESLALNDSIEKLRVGLHSPTLITLVGGIEILGKRMSLAVKLVAHHPRHHKGIGVGEQYNAVSTLAQFLHLAQIALGHIAAIALPRI